MKIGRKDLDSSLVEKIEQLDNISNTITSNISGFVSYEPNRGFYFKRASDLPYRRIYSTDEVIDLEKALHEDRPNIKSSNFVDMREKKDVYNKAFSSLSNEISAEIVYQMPAKIRKFKKYHDVTIVSDYDGNIGFFNGKDSFIVDALSLIKDNFNLEVEPFDITDISYAGNGVYISVLSFGIYHIQMELQQIEAVYGETGIRQLIRLNNSAVMAASDEDIKIVNVNSGKVIETFYNVKKSNQVPLLSTRNENSRDVFIIGESLARSSDRLVHYWKEDLAGLNFNNKDGKVASHRKDSSFEVKFINQDKNCLYISGLTGNKLFIWRYNLDFLSRDPSEFIFDCCDFSNVSSVVCQNELCVVSIENRIIVVSENTIIMNLLFENPISNLRFDGDNLVGTEDNSIVKVSLPNFSNRNETIVFNLSNNETPCNNTDIIIVGKDIGKIELYNNSGEQIFPFGSAHVRDAFVIKLLECKEQNIRLFISVTNETTISEIGIRRNNLFLR